MVKREYVYWIQETCYVDFIDSFEDHINEKNYIQPGRGICRYNGLFGTGKYESESTVWNSLSLEKRMWQKFDDGRACTGTENERSDNYWAFMLRIHSVHGVYGALGWSK